MQGPEWWSPKPKDAGGRWKLIKVRDSPSPPVSGEQPYITGLLAFGIVEDVSEASSHQVYGTLLQQLEETNTNV